MKKSAIFFILSCFLCVIDVAAQYSNDSSKVIRLSLKDGSSFNGRVMSQDSVSINFQTTGKIFITIPKQQIESTELLFGSSSGNDELWGDPNQSRLFFAPTAKPIGAGNAYFSIYELFFPTFSVGISNFFSFSAGISLIPGASSQLVYVAPKITPLKIDDFYLATGMIYIIPTSDAGDGLGIYYGLATYGAEKAALTAGIGWGFSGERFSDTPLLMLGGELKLSDNFKFITENWIPTRSGDPIVSFGIRFFGKNLAADLGFIRPMEAEYDGFPFFPWLGFAYNF